MPNNIKRKYTRRKSPTETTEATAPVKVTVKHKRSKSKNKLKIIPLGGLHEIGKNMTLFQYGNDIIIVDCGMSFPSDELLGVDLVIPDMSFLESNREHIRGMVLTHGHEDHIGAIPFALQKMDIPIYGTRLTLGILGRKLEEHDLPFEPQLNTVNAGETVELGCFSVEFIHTTHSIADAVALCIDTPVGKILHTGDFKVDYTPIDSAPIDLSRIAALGNEGVLMLMSDSTNADRPGFTESEKLVGQTFRNMFGQAKGRIIVASFASNVHRMQQVIDSAESLGRKLCVCGRSMENVLNVATELGYITIKPDTLVDLSMISNIPDDKLVILTTGSQGEPMSALTRISLGQHKKVTLKPDDTVIISANPIPGNERMVINVINSLVSGGCTVKYNAEEDIHVSGHARQEELKLMLALTKPRYFMPVHGEIKHLTAHAKLAESLGIPKENIQILKNGLILELREDLCQVNGNVQSGNVFVDGTGVGDVGKSVIEDRRRLSEDGLISVAITIDGATGQMIAGPEIVSRGFIYEKEAGNTMDYLRDVVLDACDNVNYSRRDPNLYRSAIRDAISGRIYEMCKRRPMIVCIVMEL
ncbi:MAG: ribonuclease J [Clostridia bacterium]|nr:ribonuclease J [Clostridia bacterium]